MELGLVEEAGRAWAWMQDQRTVYATHVLEASSKHCGFRFEVGWKEVRTRTGRVFRHRQAHRLEMVRSQVACFALCLSSF